MAEAQKIRDREMREIRSTNFIRCYSDRKNKDRIHKIKYVNDIIQDLERYGPVGLIHIAVLSSIIERPIKIWNANGSLNKIIGRRKTGQPVDIEYHASEGVGHWTLRGGKDPDNIVTEQHLNSCLFSVIGFQIGQDPLKLRKWTVLKLKNNFQNLAKWVDKIQLERNNKMILMIGGASYKGTSSYDASRILNESENTYSNFQDRGHARGHSFSDSPNDPYRSVVEYSYGKYKSGFLSRADQDLVTHLALKTDQAQNAMTRLNNSRTHEVITVSADELRRHCGRCNLPKVKEWHNGAEVPNSETDIDQVKLILTHHKSQFTNPDADVFIVTCYPLLNSRYPH